MMVNYPSLILRLRQGSVHEINENYLVQATFYSIAWEERTGEKIDQIVILTVTEDGALDVHKDDPSLYVKKLEEMIEEYKTGKIGDQ